MQWQTKEAKEFYLDSGGNHYDKVMGLGDDYQLMTAGMNYGKQSDRRRHRNDNSTQAARGLVEEFIESSWWEKAVMILAVVI